MVDELNPAAEHTFPAEQQEAAVATEATKKDPALEAQNTAQREASHRILRERAEAAERRSLELERYLQMNQQQQQPQKIQVVDEEDLDISDISDDSLIEGKQLKKYVKSLKQEVRNTKKQFQEYNQQIALTQADMRLKSQFSDFDRVVSKENLDKLALQKPALHRTIYSATDIYDRGYAAYEMIKGSGILNDEFQEVDKRLEDNKSKPRAAANIAPQSSDTPLTRVGDYDRRILSEERKEQLRRQVEQSKMYK